MRIVLASGSPRRRELLVACGYDVDVHVPGVAEGRAPGEAPAQMVVRLAQEKARTARTAEGLVVAADTTVVLDGQVLEKPADDADARAMLRRLSGRTHEVLTGWCVRGPRGERSGVVATAVTFRPLTDAEIDAYVASGEPRDKAGAYGIQGRGGALVDVVHGSYPNVVGLPVAEVVHALAAVA